MKFNKTCEHQVEKELHEIQKLPISKENCNTCAEIEKKVDDLNEKHEAYWYLGSRVAEVCDEDKNTSYFHHKASQRRKRNYIKGLFDDQGHWCDKEEKGESIFTSYFSNIFTSSPSEQSIRDVLRYVTPIGHLTVTMSFFDLFNMKR